MSPDSGDSSNSGKNSTGSPADGGPVFLLVGRLGRPHGLDGTLQFQVLTDFPERLDEDAQVFVGKKKDPVRIQYLRTHGNKFLIRLESVESRDDAELFRNSEVFVRAADVPALPDGEYYQHQLLGLLVMTVDGIELGSITEILSTGANDVLIVSAEGRKEILIPKTDETVREIDLEKGIVLVSLPAGLL